MSESPTTGRLVGVRLTDVPLELRLRAAAAVARSASRAVDNGKRGEDNLFARLLADRQDDGAELIDVARDPSSRVYWVPESAVRAILG